MPLSPPAGPVCIGIDAGGSGSRLLAEPAGRASQVEREGPAANLQRQGLSGTARTLANLVEESQAEVGRAHALVAGVAGAGRPSEQVSLERELRTLLGPAAPPSIRVVHDATIALEGAFEGGSGVIVVAGTGSVVFARDADGAEHRAGGWGYLLGDEGSGHALGLAGLRAACHHRDGGPATTLTRALATFGLDQPDDLIRAVYQEDWPVQRMAPAVIAAAEGGDDVAQTVLAEQVAALAQQVQWITARVGAIDPRVALIGGLSHESHYSHAFRAVLAERLPGWSLVAPRRRPVEGALRLARAAL